jgi:hypothetical protein
MLNKEILENKFYSLQNLEYKARMTYQQGETYFNIYDNPSGEQLFALKYWTKIVPIEIMKTNGNIWIKVETKDHNYGWVKSCFIELYR